MPVIRAFQGLRYNPSKISRLSSVYAPPYDVISPKEQEVLHKKSPYNVVRLILGKSGPRDTVADNRYTRAKKFLNDWVGSGVLFQDDFPSIYVYAQDYKENGKTFTRIGFLAAMKLDERAVLRHENTLASPKKDRMALLKEVRTNLSPLFGLFEDKKGEVSALLKNAMQPPPVVDVEIDGVRHRIYLESRPDVLDKIIKAMRAKPMYIADGHHRFEVACQFKNWMRLKYPKDETAGWNYVMTYFSDCTHNPFTIYPTHRLLRCPKGLKEPLKVLASRGSLEKVKDLSEILKTLSKTRGQARAFWRAHGRRGSGGPRRGQARDPKYRFGVYLKKQGFFIFTLAPQYAALIKKNPVDSLDVAALHKMIVEPCFKIKTLEKSGSIDFTRDPREACEKVRHGDFDAAFFLRPTSLGEMLLASKKGLKMPQKSTYFYPKLLSGPVFHKFEENGSRASA